MTSPVLTESDMFSLKFTRALLFIVAVLTAIYAPRATAEGAIESAGSNKVVLTADELSFLNSHDLGCAMAPNWPPINMYDQDQKLTGVAIDFWEHISNNLGIDVKCDIKDSFSEVTQAIKNRESDFMLATSLTEARKDYAVFSKPYATLPIAIASTLDRGYMPDQSVLVGKRVAVGRGYSAYEILSRSHPDIEFVEVDNTHAGLQMLSEGEVFAVVDSLPVLNWLIKKNNYRNVKVSGITNYNIDLRLMVRSDYPLLGVIFNKGIDLISEQERKQVLSRWFADEPARNLTPEENSWLRQNQTVRVWVSDWPPFMILRDNQPPTGIAIEYLELIKQRTGINFKYEETIPSFAEFLESMKQNKGPDMSPLVVRTAEREQFLSFTENYITSPNVIIGKIGDDLIWDISGLVGKTVAIPRAFKIQQQLAEQYPEITLVLFDTDEQALQAVATARVDAYMGNLTVASHIIQNRGLSDLRVVAPSPFGDHILAMGNRKDWPELTSILNKALLGITQDEKTAILQRYVALRYVTRGLSREIVLKRLLAIVAVAIGMVLLVLMWNRVLRNKVMQRTADLQAEIVERKQTENSLRDSELRFRRLIEQSPASIQIHGIGGELIQSNPAFASLYALNDESLAWLYEKYNVLEDEQARQLGLMPFIERVYKGEDVAFPPYEYNGIDTLKSLGANNPVSRKCWVKTLGFPLKDELGRVTSFVFMSEDITEQMHATEELRISESRFRVTFEQAAVGIAHVSPEGRFLRINQKFCDIVDYSRDEMLNLTFQEITYSQDLNTDMELVNSLLSGEIDTYSWEKRYIRKDGAVVWVDLTVSLLRDDAHNPLWFVAVVQDISERKMAEQVIQDYQRKLRKLAARLASTEQMERRNLAVELHDNVGQSLAVMRLQLAAVRKDTGGRKVDKILSDISSSLREAIADTRGIISSLSSPTLSELGLSAALAEYLQVKIGEHHNLETRFSDDDEPKPTNMETNQILYRSVRELLINVVKHANADLVTIDISRRKGDIQIVVEDNGKGETVERLPKQKTEEGGFGLFSIEERMQDIGGSLMIENVSGQGFRATLTAPLNPE